MELQGRKGERPGKEERRTGVMKEQEEANGIKNRGRKGRREERNLGDGIKAEEKGE